MDDIKDLKIFVPITKIDAAQRLVYGVVTAEKPDVSGEVCDYASTKPLYQQWSQKFAGATDGKSLGNLRAVHGHVAAGKLVEIAFNDEAKQVEICGKVVDDAEWQKVEEGSVVVDDTARERTITFLVRRPLPWPLPISLLARPSKHLSL